ncbi:glycosyltransferase [Thermotoga profunda]|uniref:glycosyltransferase n=1 Tax=Thermotoga profunda TaxID=1508420 RepID=UPI000693B6E7|nr:glycosyltransferase family 2 protein [Thermotoga profunda]
MLFLFEQLLLIVSWIIGWMIFAKPKFLKRQEPLIFPSVSVIIPARNEETNIAKIIRLLKEQTYKNFQIIVVNDNSTDKTRDVVLSFKGVELIDLSEEPPKGWVGKSWACWNGFLKADGEILIFMDADVEPSPEAIESLVAIYSKNKGFVSVWPYQRFEKLYEHLTLPFNMVVVGSTGSFSIFSGKPKGSYGPVIVVGRQDYARLGGHSATKSQVLEDVKLGNIFADNGYCLENYLGGELIKFRMYPIGIGQMFEGFTKNMSLGAASVGVNFFLIFLWMIGLYSAAFGIL